MDGSRLFAEGRYGQAIDHLEESLRLQQSLGDPRAEARTRTVLAALFGEIGQSQKAIELASRAVTLHPSAETLYQLGIECDRVARHADALEALDKAFALADSDDQRARIVLRRASVRFWRALDPQFRHTESVAVASDLHRALDLSRASPTLRTKALVHYGIGLIHLHRSECSEAIGYFTRALSLERRAAHRRGETRTLAAMGRAHLALHHYRQAADLLRLAADSLEVERGHVPDRYRADFVASKDDYYRHWMDSLFELHRESPEGGHEGTALAAGERLLLASDATRTIIRPVSASAVQRSLDPRAAILCYVPGNTKMYVLALTRRHRWFAAGGDKSEILALSERWRASLQAHRPDSEVASQLVKRLIEPVAGVLPASRLHVVAFAETASVPFAALPHASTGLPLGLEREIGWLPSATALVELEQKQRAPVRKVAVIADPVFSADDPRIPHARRFENRADAATIGLARLSFSRKEAFDIASLAPPGQIRLALDFDSTRDVVLDPAIRSVDVLHLSTHAVQSPDPGLVFCQFNRTGQPVDGRLRLPDIAALRLRSPLVVLSGCLTGPAAHGSGHPSASLSRAFSRAGARAVVSSLWRVEDEAAAAFMRHFYHALFVGSRTPSQALFAARMAMARTARWNHPHDWAGFVLEGDWR